MFLDPQPAATVESEDSEIVQQKENGFGECLYQYSGELQFTVALKHQPPDWIQTTLPVPDAHRQPVFICRSFKLLVLICIVVVIACVCQKGETRGHIELVQSVTSNTTTYFCLFRCAADKELSSVSGHLRWS